jgi:hypothetical protein
MHVLIPLALIRSRGSAYVPRFHDFKGRGDMQMDKAPFKSFTKLIDLTCSSYGVNQNNLFSAGGIKMCKDAIAHPHAIRLAIQVVARINQCAALVLDSFVK